MIFSATDKVAVVVVTHNRVELLRSSLEVVAQQSRPVHWIIVMDNGADPAAEKLLAKIAGDRAPPVWKSSKIFQLGSIASTETYSIILAKLSLSQRSSHHFMVTRFPNHW